MITLLGNMIAKIRKSKGLTKTVLSQKTGINIGHLTHIEKGDRTPSYEVLNTICTALEIPTRQIANSYGKNLTFEQNEYKYINYLSYLKVPAISNIDTYIDCPFEFSNAAFAYKVSDTSMAPLFAKDSYVFVEPCGSIEDKDIGLFKYNDTILIRRLLFRNGKFILKANNKNFNNIKVNSSDDFIIIGKIYI